ncbi:hypothetical protein Z949_3766 [Sulfitobacter guttiformis KCTC 32187]|nr:hypothetical protein Z949_3766 [Sulfitobacter guttiformis KCTC 32187]
MLAVAVHVICLWITSSPDVIDALLFYVTRVFFDLGCYRDVGGICLCPFGAAATAKPVS